MSVDPKTTALLVMDFQNAIVGMLDEPEPLLERTAETIATVRQAGGHIGYVRVAFTDEDIDTMPPTAAMGRSITPERRAFFAVDAPSTAIHDRVKPQDGDIIVRKTRIGAFSTTDLDAQLRARGVTTLLLAGISTSGVVLSTNRDATDRDYDVKVITDLCADPDPEVHAILTERVFARHGQTLSSTDIPALLGL